MKKIYIAFAFLAVLCSCAKELTPPKFGEVSKETDGEWVNLDGAAQVFNVEVTGDDWIVTSPTNDTWIIAYEKNGKVYVKVTKNLEDRVRESHFEVRGANGDVLRMYVRQDYDRNLAFAAPDTRIGAADGTYRIPLSTNIPSDEIEGAEVVEEGAEPVGWLTVKDVANGYLVVSVSEGNPSETESRSVKVSVTSSGYTATATITQVPMSGYPYEIPIPSSEDLSAYPVHNVIDKEHGDTIARIAREYLFKYDDNKGITYVDGVYDVIYPVTKPAGSSKGVVDYANGFVINNGGEVSWTDNIDINTAGFDMITHFAEGGLEERPTFVYIPRGATKVRVEPLSTADSEAKVAVEVRPFILQDERIGERGVPAIDEYGIVKIGKQYWINRNYAAMAYSDGERIDVPCGWDESKNPPLPSTKLDDTAARARYSDMMATNNIVPMCIVMANNSRYWQVGNDWINYRTIMGCCYTYPALIRATAGVNVNDKNKAANVNEVDAISPEGWTVPSPNDYQIMTNYLIQYNYLPTAKDRQHILIEKLCAKDATLPGKNTTGFSAKGSHISSTGGYYNTRIVYMTLDYQFASQAHYVRSFQLIDSNSFPILNMTMKASYHVRLMMKE